MAHLSLRGIHKRYGNVSAVSGIDLDIPDGEFTVLLGPSGCGKSSLLRVIAGLEDADEGDITIDGKVVNDIRAKDRDVAMVFQNYALYPYMTVYENIAFGMRMRGASEQEVRSQVDWAARMLEIGDLLKRLPRQLSGGQRQRVAMGRAMVRKPRLFLFDEPLSNLDAQLRDGMRGEIKRLHQALRITTIYVTHDQIEAMTLADRVVLLNKGRIEQAGPPMELYEQPANRFVASFLGSPPINYVDGRLVAANGTAHVVLGDGTRLTLPSERAAGMSGERDVSLGLRPEHFLRAPAGASPSIGAEVTLVQPAGSRVYVNFALSDAPMLAEFPARERYATGDTLALDVDMARAILLDPQSGTALVG